MNQQNSNEKMRISVLGKATSGKSCLIFKYIDHPISNEHDPTIEDKYNIVTYVNQTNCEVEILDTGGLEEYKNLMSNWISCSEGFVLIYAVNDKASFELLKEKRDNILRIKKGDDCPIVLVGNKCELEKERLVLKEDGINLAKNGDVLSSKLQYLQ